MGQSTNAREPMTPVPEGVRLELWAVFEDYGIDEQINRPAEAAREIQAQQLGVRTEPPGAADVGSAGQDLVAVLRARRSQYGLTQEQIGVRLALTRSSVTNFEAGRQDMPLSKVLAYADAVGVRLVPIPKEFLG